MTDKVIEPMEGIDELVNELKPGMWVEKEIPRGVGDSIKYVEAINNYLEKNEYPLVAYIKWDEEEATTLIKAIRNKMGNKNEISVSLGVIYEALGAKKKQERDKIYKNFGNFLQENGLDWEEFEDLGNTRFWQIEKCNNLKKIDEERCRKCFSICKKLPKNPTKIKQSSSKVPSESNSSIRKTIEPDIKYYRDLYG